jgi:hypothetical protein
MMANENTIVTDYFWDKLRHSIEFAEVLIELRNRKKIVSSSIDNGSICDCIDSFKRSTRYQRVNRSLTQVKLLE